MLYRKAVTRAIDDTLRHFYSPMKAVGSTSAIAEERAKVNSHLTEWEDANSVSANYVYMYIPTADTTRLIEFQ